MIKTVTMITSTDEDVQYETSLRDLNIFTGVASHLFDSDFDGVKVTAVNGKIIARQEVER